MTDYKDLKIDPDLRDVLQDAAEQHYGETFRAISRSGHEAVIAWLIMVPDADTRDAVLADHGFDSVSDLVDYLDEGRFRDDDLFDPLAAVRTRTRDVGGDGDDA